MRLSLRYPPLLKLCTVMIVGFSVLIAVICLPVWAEANSEITGIKVAVDLTTSVLFKMEATVIPGQEVTIVAERPIVERHVAQIVPVE